MAEHLPVGELPHGEQDEDWDELAREVRAHLREVRQAHLRERQKSLLFYLYVVALFAAFYLAPYTGGLLQLAEHTGVVTPLAERLAAALPLAATGLALLALLAAVSDGLWRGPVVLDAAVTGWVLPAPAAWQGLLRARLRFSAATYALGGGVATLALGFLAQIGVRARVSAMLVAVGAAGVALGALAVALGTLVERYDTRVRASSRLLGAARLLALVLLGLAVWAAWSPGSVPDAVGTVALWSGPWGWAAQPLVAAADPGRAGAWPAGLVLAAVLAGALGTLAWQRGSQLDGPVLRARVGSSRGVVAALLAGDLRQAALTVRSATAAQSRPPRFSPRAPRSRWLVVPWRVLLGWLRAPARVGWALLGLALAYAAVGLAARVDGWERAVTAAVALAVAYAAAGQLLEAARVEADDVRPSRSLPLRFADLLLLHAALPVLVLLVAGGVAVGVTAASGGAAGAAAGLLLGTPALVAACLVSACRGPLPARTLMGSDTAFGNTAIGMIALWYLRAPLAGLVVALPAVLIGAARGLTPGVVEYAVLGTAVMVAWARWEAQRHYAR
ncbi:hypothetical protein CLV35_0193 [Motilibacter peucedani]|uniref:ABC-2 type transport system permease protein n=1 Tax=Motilibacter peucedani TaxID=598650 RepID=A0A420XV79_9ACTN|nr:hypothetical protein [Motilibacter peucedani]RKS80726.1 hypothetical protein CLV35_0193 [Motilibacter peucedani]